MWLNRGREKGYHPVLTLILHCQMIKSVTTLPTLYPHQRPRVCKHIPDPGPDATLTSQYNSGHSQIYINIYIYVHVYICILPEYITTDMLYIDLACYDT